MNKPSNIAEVTSDHELIGLGLAALLLAALAVGSVLLLGCLVWRVPV